MTDLRIIKRYTNRKLYDTKESQYVTLEQISEMIREGDEVTIIDNKSKEDLTSVTLAQIIFEEEKKQNSFLPLQAMRNIIQSGGESITQLLNQAQRRVHDILPKRDDEDDSSGEPVGESDSEASDEKSGHLEFREWLIASQRAIEDWQKKMDGRIRDVARGITPFAGLQNDVRVLAERVADLEQKLSAIVEEEELSVDDDE
jgi:polyhydroxyalkanoate synthesis repressor PhaR